MTEVTQLADVLRTHLCEHYLVEIRCDHDAKTDQAICACARWTAPIKASVGEAIAAWADHVLESVPPAQVTFDRIQEALGRARWQAAKAGTGEPSTVTLAQAVYAAFVGEVSDSTQGGVPC